MNALARFKRFIVNEPWDTWLERQDRLIGKFIVCPFLAAAIAYFGTIAYIALRRMP